MSPFKRRDFLIQSGLGLAATFGPWSPLLSARTASAKASDDPVRAAFRAALPERPWLLGVSSIEREHFEAPAEIVHGALPDTLRGTFFRNGPARHEVAGERYQHSFDGDGVLQAYRIAGGSIRHEARLIETRKVAIERRAGRRLLPGFGTPPAPGFSPKDNNEMNVANISVTWQGDRLLALWEGGDAYEIAPDTLASEGPYHWSTETAGMPFSAHPRIEPDGTMWNFGSIGWMGKLALYRIGASGKLEAVHVMDFPKAGMIHDFTVTERHLVFLMPPLLVDPEAEPRTFLDRHVWHGDEPMRVLLVDKNDLSKHTWLEGPTAFVFHFGNAWEEKDGTIHVDFCRHPNADLVFGALRRVMWGEELPSEPGLVTKWTIDPKRGRIQEDIGVEMAEFPSVDPRIVGRRHTHVVTLGRRETPDTPHPGFNSVVRHDMETGASQAFTYPGNVLPEEHVVVPGEAGGPDWIVGTGLDYERRAQQLAVFREDQLEDGPVALARLPYWLPTGLHGRFVPA